MKVIELFNKRIKSTFAELHHVEEDDYEFIYKLRFYRKNSFLQPIDKDPLVQKKYLGNYLAKFKNYEEIYYKIYDKKSDSYKGLVRLTEIDQEVNFNWESLIVEEGTPAAVTLDVIITVYFLGFIILERKVCGPWKVRKNFDNMMKIHEKMRMVEILSEEKEFFNLIVKEESFRREFNRFQKLGFARINDML